MILYIVYIDKTVLYDPLRGINNGLTAATLSLEVNQPESFTMKIQNGSSILSSLAVKKTLVYVYEAYIDSNGVFQDEYYPFMGRINDISIDINGDCDVTCEGAFAFLNDVVMSYFPQLSDGYKGWEKDARVFYYNSAKYIFKSAVDATKLISENADSYPFNKMIIEFDESASDWMPEEYDYSIAESDFDFPDVNPEELEYLKAADVINTKVINSYSGVVYFLYYLWRSPDTPEMEEPREDQTGLHRIWEKSKHPIKMSYTHDINPGFGYNHSRLEFPTVEAVWVEDYGWYPSFGIGDNILSISKESVKTDIYTGIMPVGKDGLKLHNVKKHFDPTNVDEVQYNYYPVYNYDIIWIPELISKYGYIIKTVEFSDIETVAELRQAGENYVNRFAKDFGFKYTINAIEPCEVFDNMNKLVKLAHITMVKDTDNVVHVMPCLSMKLDLFDIQNNEYVIGPVVPESIINEDISNV